MAETNLPNDEQQPDPQSTPRKQRKRGGDRTPANILMARIHEVFKLRLGGAEFLDLMEFAKEKGWNVCKSTMWNYIRRADDLCERYYDPKARYLHSRHLLQRRQLFAHAMNAGDFRTALSVLQDEAKLANLYPANKVEAVYRNLRSLEQMSDEELARIAAAGVEDADSGAGGGGAGDSGEAESPDESA